MREERIERDPKAFVAYINNVDVGQPLWRAEPRDKSVSLVLCISYILLVCSCLLSSRTIRICSRSTCSLCSKACLVCRSSIYILGNLYLVLDLFSILLSAGDLVQVEFLEASEKFTVSVFSRRFRGISQRFRGISQRFRGLTVQLQEKV